MKYRTSYTYLKKLAVISPKSFAQDILERNLLLLGALKALRGAQLGSPIDQPVFKVCFTSLIGCPHCNQDCESCLWAKAMGSHHSDPCCEVYFGGSTLNLVSIQSMYRIDYGANLESVHAHYNRMREYHTPEIATAQFEACERFLEAHITWAKRPYWGSEL